MARKPDDWMPLVIGKYLANTAHLTRDQHGAYLLLSMAYWTNGGPLDADDGELAAVAKATPREWKHLRKTIAKFFEERDGKWHHHFLDGKLREAKELTEKKAEAGARGGHSKWGSEKDRENQRTRSQRLSDARARGTHSKEEWDVLVEIFDGTCVRCSAKTDKPFKDHILPIYKGGSDAIENLQPLCRSCNSAKGPEEIDHRQNACQDWYERLAKRLTQTKQTPTSLPSTLTKNSEEQPSEQVSSAPQAGAHIQTETQSDPKPSRKPKPEPEGFASWYDAYPLHKARPPAAKAYAVALTKTDAETLLEGARAYARARAGEDAQFTAHPATWLNEERWADEEISHGSGARGSRPPQQQGRGVREAAEHALAAIERGAGEDDARGAGGVGRPPAITSTARPEPARVAGPASNSSGDHQAPGRAGRDFSLPSPFDGGAEPALPDFLRRPQGLAGMADSEGLRTLPQGPGEQILPEPRRPLGVG